MIFVFLGWRVKVSGLQYNITSYLMQRDLENAYVMPRHQTGDNMMTSSNGNMICIWINGWANNREAGGLRRYRAHYDAIVM